MSGAFDKMSDIGTSWLYDAGLGDLAGEQDPRQRTREKAGRKAERAKLAARKRLKPIPDPEATKSEARKKAARSRAGRKGRASTMLSDSAEKLG